MSTSRVPTAFAIRTFPRRRPIQSVSSVSFAARSGTPIIVAIAWILCPVTASASGDIGCTSAWKLRHRDLTGCDSVAMLAPGNDTRVNLVLLMNRNGKRPSPSPATPSEPHPGPLFDWGTFQRWTFPNPATVVDEDRAEGEGSRCRSDAGGIADVVDAVGAARKLTAPERSALVAARKALHPTCSGEGPDTAATGNAATAFGSPTAKAFAAYLQGAEAFYAGRFDTATARFASLQKVDDPWLRETASYMLGRVEVNRAQIGAFDEYGYRDNKHPADAAVVASAEQSLRQYLRSYPEGHYALSARGLIRRVYWLAAERPKLAAEYAALFAQTPDRRGVDDSDLAEEIDNKLLPQLTVEDTADPILLAVIDLQLMRGADADAPADAKLSQAALEAQRPRFARDPALFEHLLACYAFYVMKRPADVLRLVADAARQPAFDSVQFSRQMLRGMALDAIGDRNAGGFWRELIDGASPPFQRVTVELGIGLHAERNGGLAELFDPGSPVRDPSIRDILLTNVASPSLLRRQAGNASAGPHERAVALFTLLYKELTRGAYRDFVADLRAVPAGAASKPDIYDFVGTSDPSLGVFTKGVTAEDFACPALADTAGRLANDPRNATARLCLAEFIRLNGLDGFFLDAQPPSDELGGTRSQFPGQPFSRLEIYKAVIAAAATSDQDRAYALFRAVNCYAPSRKQQLWRKRCPACATQGLVPTSAQELPDVPLGPGARILLVVGHFASRRPRCSCRYCVAPRPRPMSWSMPATTMRSGFGRASVPSRCCAQRTASICCRGRSRLDRQSASSRSVPRFHTSSAHRSGWSCASRRLPGRRSSTGRSSRNLYAGERRATGSRVSRSISTRGLATSPTTPSSLQT